MNYRSVVEYFGLHERYKCGYCGGEDTNYSHGMWAHRLAPEDYQNLMDRGWRRSGKFCYKPLMTSACCPQYTIRCDALNFKLSKSQKKVLKRMKHFLVSGQVNKRGAETQNMSCDEMEQPMECPVMSDLNVEEMAEAKHNVDSFHKKNRIEIRNEGRSFESEAGPSSQANMMQTSSSQEVPALLTQNISSGICDNVNLLESEKVKSVSEGDQMETNSPQKASTSLKHYDSKDYDPDKPWCRKAKEIRREKYKQKLLKRGLTEEEISNMKPKQKCHEKSLEDFISEASVENAAHELELRVIKVNQDDAYIRACNESFPLYQKYQISIHNEPSEECNEQIFLSFLGEAPMEFPMKNPNFDHFFGAYHQQYWLDGQMIAVGVIDILPNCVSSVYLFYDPDYAFLSLGTYAALREVAFVRELHKRYQNLKYYYMGFYIHSCPKMKYKGCFSPSYLLCPETYVFKPIEECIPKLTQSKYCRLEEDAEKEDTDGVVVLQDVQVFFRQLIISYISYVAVTKSKDEDLVKEYAHLVGQKCYERMLLYRSP